MLDFWRRVRPREIGMIPGVCFSESKIRSERDPEGWAFQRFPLRSSIVRFLVSTLRGVLKRYVGEASEQGDEG